MAFKVLVTSSSMTTTIYHTADLIARRYKEIWEEKFQYTINTYFTQEGGDLASIHSLDENSFLESFVVQRPVLPERGGER